MVHKRTKYDGILRTDNGGSISKSVLLHPIHVTAVSISVYVLIYITKNYRTVGSFLFKIYDDKPLSVRDAFERSVSVKYLFRSRTDFGVISRYSSSDIISSPRSIESS